MIKVIIIQKIIRQIDNKITYDRIKKHIVFEKLILRDYRIIE